jgi:hypothetical protein
MESMRRERCSNIRNSRGSSHVKRKLWGKGKKKSKVIHITIDQYLSNKNSPIFSLLMGGEAGRRSPAL